MAKVGKFAKKSLQKVWGLGPREQLEGTCSLKAARACAEEYL